MSKKTTVDVVDQDILNVGGFVYTIRMRLSSRLSDSTEHRYDSPGKML